MSLHVIPENDEREHELTLDCWCGAHVDWINPDTGIPWESGLGPKVHHAASDCREFSEQVTGEKVEEGKGWILLWDDGTPAEQG